MQVTDRKKLIFSDIHNFDMSMKDLKTANSVCRGAGDSHLPRSLRARSPHVLFPVGGSTAKGRAPKVREPTGTAHDRRGIPP